MINISDFGPKRSLKDLFSFDKFVLFGAGESSNEVFNYLFSKGKKIVAFFDNNTDLIGKKRNNISIYSSEDIYKYIKKDVAFVITSSYQYEIATQLINTNGVKLTNVFPYVTEMFSEQYNPSFIKKNESHIKNLIKNMADPESKDYLVRLMAFRWTMDPRFLRPNNNIKSFYNYNIKSLKVQKDDVVVDCGAYIGDTAELYLKQIDGKCKIYAIEAFPSNFDILKKWIFDKKVGKKVIPVQIAVGSKEGVIHFSYDSSSKDPRATMTAKKKNDSTEIKVTTIDNLFTKIYPSKVDFIKMDIEGAEKDAILGGKNIIKKYKPNLVVASYHKPSHVWELPELLLKLNKNYSIYAGHHPKCIYEVEYYLTNN